MATEVHERQREQPQQQQQQGVSRSPELPLEPLSFSLRGKVALVTGASSGIGRVFATYLVQQGCHVAAAARRTGQLDSLAAEVRTLAEMQGCSASSSSSSSSLQAATSREPRTPCQPGNSAAPAGQAGRAESCSCCSGARSAGERGSSCPPGPVGEVLPVSLDVTAPEAEIDAAVGRAWDHFGGINVLVNNAGHRGSKAAILDIKDADFMRTLATNVRGPWVVTKAVMRRVVAARRAQGLEGRDTAKCGDSHAEESRVGSGKAVRSVDLLSPVVVNIASTAGLEGALLPNGGAYSASKSGVIRLTKAMAIELGQHGIRCNAIAPGIFKSDITENLLKKEWMHRNAKVVVPLQRWGSTHPDLTSALHYLIADCSRHVTGTCIVVDGGHSLMRMRLDPRL